MSVSVTTAKTQTTGDGTTTSFSVPFPLYEASAIEVYLDDTLQSRYTDYTLGGLTKNTAKSYDSGFTVEFEEAPGSGVTVTILRKTPKHQPNKLYNDDVFDIQVLENSYDNQTMQFQELSERLSDALSDDSFSIGFQGPWRGPKARYLVSCLITENSGGGNYKIKPAAPENGSSDWIRTGLPDIEFDAFEASGNSGFPVDTKVLAKAFEDSAGDAQWVFIVSSLCDGSDQATAALPGDCDPTGSGVDPETGNISDVEGTITGSSDPCSIINNTNNIAFTGFTSDANSYVWAWDNGGAMVFGSGIYAVVRLIYARANHSHTPPQCTAESLVEGRYYLEMEFNIAGFAVPIATWFEEASGFACSGSTGKISGTHSYTVGPCYSDDCTGTPVFTVDP